MISRLLIDDPVTSATSWWSEVEGLKGKYEITFADGLNILWGRNGVGKSTVITTMVRMLHCEQGGVPKLTSTSLRNVFASHLGVDRYLDGVVPEHDGQAVLFCNGGTAVGSVGGTVDEDFFREGLVVASARKSAGQGTLMQLTRILDMVTGKNGATWPEIDATFGVGVNSLWQERVKRASASLKGTLPIGRRTLLLDEPDRSLDIDNQAALWQIVARIATKIQVIAATHSPFVLSAKANFISLTPGYLEECREAVKKLASTAV